MAFTQTPAQFFLTPGDAWQAMMQDCLAARKSIYLEQYILMNDDLGRGFLKMFTDKVKEGVLVHLSLDRVGSRTIYGTTPLKEFKQAGGTVRFYNRIGLLNLFFPKTWFPRNHSKNLVIDSEIAYTGSACMAEHMRFWRDTQVRVTGALAAKIERQPKTNTPMTADGMDFIATRPSLHRNALYKELLHRIHHAKKEIRLVTPYFLPPRRLLTLLIRAVKRGVDVQILMSRESDSRFVDYTSYSYLPRMFRGGLRVFLYNPTVMHAKYMLIDGEWATVGSTNLDYLSLLRNRESNLLVHDPQVIAEIERHYHDDLHHCDEINMAFYRRLPLVQRLLGRIGHSFRWML